MHRYLIYGKDNKGLVYVDEVISSLDLRDRFNIGEILKSSYYPERKIFKIEESEY